MYDKVCRYCGKRLSEFYNTGLLGCPHCYEEFEREVYSAIQDVQADCQHIGKRPSLSGLDKELLDEYRALLQEKEQAGLKGNFSEMAKLSDEIFELKEELIRRGLI